jgi:hypothetical protein
MRLELRKDILDGKPRLAHGVDQRDSERRRRFHLRHAPKQRLDALPSTPEQLIEHLIAVGEKVLFCPQEVPIFYELLHVHAMEFGRRKLPNVARGLHDLPSDIGDNRLELVAHALRFVLQAGVGDGFCEPADCGGEVFLLPQQAAVKVLSLVELSLPLVREPARKRFVRGRSERIAHRQLLSSKMRSMAATPRA